MDTLHPFIYSENVYRAFTACKLCAVILAKEVNTQFLPSKSPQSGEGDVGVILDQISFWGTENAGQTLADPKRKKEKTSSSASPIKKDKNYKV